MTKRIRRAICCILLAMIAALWVWRYITLNRYYSALDKSSVQYYSMGEEVPFEDDFVEWQIPANGYYIRVDGFEILNYDEYLDAANYDFEPLFESEGIALVYITLRNENSTDPGIYLTDFCLHGIDSIQGMDWQVLTAANPILGGVHGIQLKQGTQQQFVLPFYIRKDSFGIDTWRNLEDYTFYLRVTTVPTQKDIRLELTHFAL